MRKSAILLLTTFCMLSGLMSCQEKFVTSTDLAVDNTQLDLPSSDAGYFHVHILSNRSWTISIESEKDWLHPQQTSGHGTAYPKFTYDSYLGGVDREATIVISCDVKTLRIKVVQPKSE